MCEVCKGVAPNHETETMITPPGYPVEIDKNMVGLIRWLWDNDIRTDYSCEDQGNGKWYFSCVSMYVDEVRMCEKLVHKYLGDSATVWITFAQNNRISPYAWKFEGLTEELK